jgi:hypothetical protein
METSFWFVSSFTMKERFKIKQQRMEEVHFINPRSNNFNYNVLKGSVK